MMQDIVMALGLVLVIEGLFYALVPGHLKRMLDTMRTLSDDQMRVGGIMAMSLGVAIVWVARAWFA